MKSVAEFHKKKAARGEQEEVELSVLAAESIF